MKKFIVSAVVTTSGALVLSMGSLLAQTTTETNMHENGIRFDREGNMYVPVNETGVDYFQKEVTLDGSNIDKTKRYSLQNDDTLKVTSQPETVVKDSIEHSVAIAHGRDVRVQTAEDKVKLAADKQYTERLNDGKHMYAENSPELKDALNEYKDQHGIKGDIDANEVANRASNAASNADSQPIELDSKKHDGRNDNTKEAAETKTREVNQQEITRASEDPVESGENPITQNQSSNSRRENEQPIAENKNQKNGSSQGSADDVWEIDVSELESFDEGVVVLNQENHYGLPPGEIVGLDGIVVLNEANNWGFDDIDTDQLERDIHQFNVEEERRKAIEQEQARLTEIARQQQLAKQREVTRAERRMRKARDTEVARQEKEKGSYSWSNILAQGMALYGMSEGLKHNDADLVQKSLQFGAMTSADENAAEVAAAIGGSSTTVIGNSGDTENCSSDDQRKMLRALQDLESQGACNGAGQRYVNFVKKMASSGSCGYNQSHITNAKSQCNACSGECY